MIFVHIRQRLTRRKSVTLRKFLLDMGKSDAFGAL